jgi:short-subunit dehydrogenase
MMKHSISPAPTALITGASSGIGYALSHELARRGYHTILVARNTEKLEALAQNLRSTYGITSTVIPFDLAKPNAATELFKTLTSRTLTVDILVNNAGFGYLGEFAKADWESQVSMLQVNIATLVHLTQLVLPSMLARKSGKILNVGSTGSFSPVPTMAVYAATKAFVLSFSEALAVELKNTGVTVTALCPGATNTGFAERAQAHKTLLFKSAMSAETVAHQGIQALFQGKKRIVTGWLNKLMIASIRFTPRDLVLLVSHAMMRSKA